MGFEKKAEPSKLTVKMKYVGHFTGVEKIVQLPIPLIAKSQKLEEVLSFKRTSESRGPGFCDVPVEWVGALIDVGGNWRLVEEPSTELMVTIRSAQEACNSRMAKFALENELVDA